MFCLQSTAQNEKHVNRKLTAIDFYLWACFLFVIFAMLEFALSDYGTFRSNNPSPPGGKGGGVSRGGGPKEVKIAKKPVHVNFNALKQDTAITSAPKCKLVISGTSSIYPFPLDNTYTQQIWKCSEMKHANRFLNRSRQFHVFSLFRRRKSATVIEYLLVESLNFVT